MSNLLPMPIQMNDRAFSTRSDVSKVSGKADWRAENPNAAPMRSRSPSICSKNGKPLAMAPLASFTFPSGQGNSSNFRSDEVAGQPIVLKELKPQRSQSTDVGGLTVSAEPSRDDVSSLDEHSLSRSWALWEKTVAPDDCSSSESDCESVISDRQPSPNYNDCVSHIKEFNSIESFMTLFNGIPPPSAIVNKNHIFRQMKTLFDITTDESSEDETASQISKRSGSILGRRPIPGVIRQQKQLDAVMFFETGVTPVWEDPAHKNGGVMEFTFKTDFPGDVVDDIWERLLFSILGNSIPNGEFITGIRMADRLPPKMTHFNAIVGVRLEVWHREMTQKMCDQLRKHFTEVITAPLSIGGNVIARRTVHKGSYATKTPIFYVKRAPPSAEREAKEYMGPKHRRGSV